jgi:hypothetical protein
VHLYQVRQLSSGGRDFCRWILRFSNTLQPGAWTIRSGQGACWPSCPCLWVLIRLLWSTGCQQHCVPGLDPGYAHSCRLTPCTDRWWDTQNHSHIDLVSVSHGFEQGWGCERKGKSIQANTVSTPPKQSRGREQAHRNNHRIEQCQAAGRGAKCFANACPRGESQKVSPRETQQVQRYHPEQSSVPCGPQHCRNGHVKGKGGNSPKSQHF